MFGNEWIRSITEKIGEIKNPKSETEVSECCRCRTRLRSEPSACLTMS